MIFSTKDKFYLMVTSQLNTIILLSLKEAGQFPELNALMKHIPQKYIEILENYFEKMIEKGKIRKVDPSTVATNLRFDLNIQL